jgi:hypothetical protein
MASSHNDTSDLRVWLASQLGLQDVPDEIWEYLREKRFVEDALDPDYKNGKKDLLKEARTLLRIQRAGSGTQKTSKRQPTGKRRRATAASRSRAVAEIAAKIDEARAARSHDGSPKSGEDGLRDFKREEWERRTAELPRGPEPEKLELSGIEPPRRSSAHAPIMGEIRNNRITVTAKPWVSPEEVRQQYQSLQKVWFRKQTPSKRQLELVRFVTGLCEGYCDEERGVVGLVPSASWREMLDRWNERYPQDHDWHYADVRNFYRDFREAFEALTLFEDF